jgi:phage baseplate assembly protein W
MLPNYYTFPLNCQKIMEKQRQPRCSLADSIRQHIHLILRTHFNEYRFDPRFGCMVWDKDFETIRSVYKWKTELIDAFAKALKSYEKRLQQIQVVVDLDDQKILDPHTQKLIELRKRIIIHAAGTIGQTNESFQHTEYIFFSPLSLT